VKAPVIMWAMLCLPAAATAADDDAVPRKAIAALRTEHPPILDGRLDDAVWQEAAFVEDLHIVVSDEFGEPGQRSRVYVAYDDDYLYFAARFWDSNPDQVVSKVLSKRDVSFGEDGFSVTLDPYDQGRSGYIFDNFDCTITCTGMYFHALFGPLSGPLLLVRFSWPFPPRSSFILSCAC